MRIEIPEMAALSATLERTYGDNPKGDVFVVLRFGSAEVGRWDVTDRRTEFESWYLTAEERAAQEMEWLSDFIAPKLSSAWGLE